MNIINIDCDAFHVYQNILHKIINYFKFSVYEFWKMSAKEAPAGETI